jgi:hypothetical protein
VPRLSTALAAVLLAIFCGGIALADEPTPAAESPLPDIGRTHSRTVCSVMRDTVGPAILATQRADKHFADARDALFSYVTETNTGARNLKHAQLDRVAVAMAEEVRKLKTAIEDPAFAAAAPPPASGEAAALFDARAALRTLYDNELAQLNALSGFVTTERFAQIRTELEEADLIRKVSDLPARGAPAFGPGADRPTSAQQRPNQLANAHELDRWTGRVAAETTKNEEAASRVILRVAALCR